MAESKAALDAIPLRNLKYGESGGETPRQNPTPAGRIVDTARKRAGLEVKDMAADMDVSESFLLRGLKDEESLSWQRIRRVKSARFHQEFLEALGEQTEGVELERTLRIVRKRPA